MKPRDRGLLTRVLLSQIAGYRAESLIGDLTEQYVQGRGALWYWRQVMLAILTSYLRLLRIHGLSFFGAIAVGAAGVQTCLALVQWMSEAMWRWELAMFGPALTAADLRALEHILFWVAWTPFTAVIYSILGRLIAAIHPAHSRWVVCLFTAFILQSRLPWTIRLFLIDEGDGLYVSYAVQDLTATLICVVGAWLGFLFHLRTQRHIELPERELPE